MRPMSATKTVLVVDDELAIVQLARDYLEHAGFTVLTAADGTTALATIRQRQPDLIVLKWACPGPTAWTSLAPSAATRRRPSSCSRRATTSSTSYSASNSGADDYLTKPFSPRELVARVKAVLR